MYTMKTKSSDRYIETENSRGWYPGSSDDLDVNYDITENEYSYDEDYERDDLVVTHHEEYENEYTEDFDERYDQFIIENIK